jgi:hypothetical protein
MENKFNNAIQEQMSPENTAKMMRESKYSVVDEITTEIDLLKKPDEADPHP